MEPQQFFQHFAPLLGGLKHVTLVIATHDDLVTVSVHVTPRDVKDAAIGQIVPLTLTTTAAELDEYFFSKITVPLETQKTLFANLAEHEASVEKARKNSTMETTRRAEERKKETQQKTAASKEADKQKEDDKQARTMLGTLATLYPDNLQKQLKTIDSFLEAKPSLSEEIKAEVVATREKITGLILSPTLF